MFSLVYWSINGTSGIFYRGRKVEFVDIMSWWRPHFWIFVIWIPVILWNWKPESRWCFIPLKENGDWLNRHY